MTYDPHDYDPYDPTIKILLPIPVERPKKIRLPRISITEEEQLLRVGQNIEAIRFIENPSEEAQLAAVEQDGLLIEYIENPSEVVKIAAVTQDGSAIKYIENPSEAVQMAAVSKEGGMLYFIFNPDSLRYSDKKDEVQIDYLSEAVQLSAVQNDTFGDAIKYIENPSEEVQLAAVHKNANAIKYIKNPSEEVQLVAVTQDGWVIQHIENPSDRVKVLAELCKEHRS